MSPVLILGAGFTGSRVASLLQAIGHEVISIRRSQIDFSGLAVIDPLRRIAPPGCLVLHSIPSLPEAADAKLLVALEGKASRVVYLSTTGVYGGADYVDENTPIAPRNPREQARVDTEIAVEQGAWASLILRPAAIYGPGRGVHVSMAQGRYALHGGGDNFISRIHVDDLANVAAAALVSNHTGAYPVADEHPCTAREIAEYCARKFELPPPIHVAESEVPISRRNNRKVDGRAIFRELGITLKYSSYVEGLDAS